MRRKKTWMHQDCYFLIFEGSLTPKSLLFPPGLKVFVILPDTLAKATELNVTPHLFCRAAEPEPLCVYMDIFSRFSCDKSNLPRLKH